MCNLFLKSAVKLLELRKPKWTLHWYAETNRRQQWGILLHALQPVNRKVRITNDSRCFSHSDKVPGLSGLASSAPAFPTPTRICSRHVVRYAEKMSRGSSNENRYRTINHLGTLGHGWIAGRSSAGTASETPAQRQFALTTPATIKRRRYQRNRQFRRRENGDPSCCCITHLDWTNRFWWARQDLNLGPTDYESAALTAELRAPACTSF